MKAASALAILFAALLFLAASPAWAATFTVDMTGDPTPATASACTSAPGDCSLRGAVIAANAATGLDTITVPPETYLLTIRDVNDESSATGDLDITDDVAINGAGAATTTVSAGGEDADATNDLGARVFHVVNAEAEITGLTVSGGSDVLVGAGILNFDSNLTLTDSAVSGNSATDAGGGIFNVGGDLTLTDSTVSGNSATNVGGGIINFDDDLTITGSTVSGNSSTDGGGVFSVTDLSGTEATIENSTISDNSASGVGGGFYNVLGLATIRSSTITDNTAPRGQGAGVASDGDNSTRTVVSSSIIADNSTTDVDLPPDGGDINSFSSEGHNLVGDGNAAGEFNETGDQVIGNASPGLGELANNGGPTETHALLLGSPAIDKGDDGSATPTTDQRGQPRPKDFTNIDNAPGGDGSDIGAFELGLPEASVSPASLDFGEQEIEKLGAAKSVNVTNSGMGPLSISSVAKSGPNRSDFIKTDDDCTGAVLDPGESCNVVLRFSPEAAGDRSAELVIESNDPDDPSMAVLSGIGTETPEPANPNACTIVGTSGDDRLVGTPGRDIICGRGGNDTIYGGAGNDQLIGGPGRDRLFGQGGNDRLNARDGVRANDAANGGAGRDRCTSDPGDTKRSCP